MNVDLESFRRSCEAEGLPIIRRDTEQKLRELIGEKQPRRILEIGTCVGYSGLVLLSCCEGRLTTVEIREEHYRRAKQVFSEAGVSERVFAILGDCRDVVPNLTQHFDAVFLDGPKGQYLHLWPYLRDLLDPGGMLIADNVDFHGTVHPDVAVPHRDRTRQVNLLRFRDAVFRDPKVKTQYFAIGDGLTVSVRPEGEKA